MRKFFWKIAFKNIYRVTSPTIETKKRLIAEKIIQEDKIILLRDPIISPKKIIFLAKKKTNEKPENYYISIGRLTHQKNYHFLINCFYEIVKKDNTIKLIILGEGELKEDLKKQIDHLKMNNNIFLLGYQNNVYEYLKNAKAFILSSLWEDPGFVLIEAAFCNLNIISSNCPNGPSELLNNGKDGFMYKSNNKEYFLIKFNEYLLTDKKHLFVKKFAVKKNTKNFAFITHSKKIKKIL